MITQADEPRRGGVGWMPLIIAGVVYTVIICVVVAIRVQPGSTSDFNDFWQTALHYRQTGQISSELGVHNYLPFFTLFMTPWSFLPLPAAAVVFTLLSLGLFALTVVLTETLLNDGLGPWPRKATLAVIGLILAYVHSCGVLGQVGLLLLFLVVATWFLVERGREWTAGMVLGLAALIKLLPAVLIVFFLLKRRWRVAGTALATMIVIGFGTPLVGIGLEETIKQHQDFRWRAVEEHGARHTIMSDKPRKAKYSNNALPMVLRRLLTPLNGDPSDNHPEKQIFVNFADLPRSTIWWIYVAMMVVVGGGCVALGLRCSRPWPPATAEDGFSMRAQYGLWCCLMLIASPLLWTHYLPLAYWPLALVTDRGERVDQALKRPCVISLVTMLCWLAGVVLLAWPAARASGAQIISVLVIWVAMLLYAWGKYQRIPSDST